MEFFEALLNILAIVGVITAGGFIIFFLSDMLLTLLSPKHSKSEKEKLKAENERALSREKDLDFEKQNFKEGTISEFVPDEENEFDFKNDNEFDFKNENEEFSQSDKFDSEKFVRDLKDNDFFKNFKDTKEKNDSDLNNLFNDNDFNFTDDFDFNFLDEKESESPETIKELPKLKDSSENLVYADKYAYADARSGETISEIKQKNSRNEFFEKLEMPSENFKSPYEKFNEKPVNTKLPNNFIETKVENQMVKPVETQSESTIKKPEPFSRYNYIEVDKIGDVDAGSLNFETINESRLNEEIKFLKQELFAQKLEYERLKKEAELNDNKLKTELSELEKLYEQSEQQEIKSAPLLTIEEYKSRIEVLKSRLKANEKELKANKKEFIPLRRVRKNLDNDKKKLRRREALVAKQKVMLYGVNNIAEIDEEKAKKLAQDLDLLDGLKISVQHCEEVMETNKERYPILETTYRILTTVSQDLKDDIAECEANIKKLKGINDDDNDGNIVVEAKAILNGKDDSKTRKKVKKLDETDSDEKKPELMNDNINDEIQSVGNEINVTLSESDLEENKTAEKDAFDFESESININKKTDKN